MNQISSHHNLGYDTTAQTLAYAGYELTKNPEVMKQLQDEVDAAYEEANGKTPDYSVIQVLNNTWIISSYMPR
jgi:cytochrome P450